MNGYNVINKFECCGKIMVSVRMESAVCVMPEKDFARIIKAEKWNSERVK